MKHPSPLQPTIENYQTITNEEAMAMMVELRDYVYALPVELRSPCAMRCLDEHTKLIVKHGMEFAAGAVIDFETDLVQFDRELLSALRAGDMDAIRRFIHGGPLTISAK